MKTLVFELASDEASFSIPETSSSKLSYAFPPRTTVSGILGAILGIEKNICQEMFGKNKVSIAVGIRNPISTRMIKTNGMKVESGKKNARAQLNEEFIVDPRYRIYVSCSDEDMYNDLVHLVKIGRPRYMTIGLGRIDCFTYPEYIGEFESTHVNEISTMEVHSVIPYKKGKMPNYEIGSEHRISVKSMTNEMNNNRDPIDVINALYDLNANPITVTTSNIYKLSNGENIIFL